MLTYGFMDAGKSTSETLNWEDRLRITMEAAQGQHIN